ncbi:hypothetical protein EGW08_016301 [Elysia chlorotica]|uniref:Uncharacterized protein n=1 Tax=Elysia chlorotica TaxID=188477 RepID=A0A433T323_ELYCH|nr:hypothetical protein EGW08_016301 [Elysia chlorotica]
MSCWALWQRLPLRYQLSLRESDASLGSITPVSSPHRARSPRAPLSAGTITRSPRRAPMSAGTATRTPGDCRVKSSTKQSTEKEQGEHQGCATSNKRQPALQNESTIRGQRNVGQPQGKGRATMFFTVQTSPREGVGFQTSHRQTAFPSRSSPFLTNFKQNQRMNCARQSFTDPSTIPPASPRRSKARQSKMQTAGVQFPVTKFEPQVTTNVSSTSSLPSRLGSGPSPVQNQNNIRAPSVRLTNTPDKPEVRGKGETNDLSVNTLLFVNETKPFVRNPVYSEAKNQRYVLKTGQASSVLIDNDRVVVMKSATPSTQSATVSRENSASYLAHLRKLYLRDPKDFAKANRPYGPERIKKKLLFERLEYEKRTDSILNYYSREDDVEMAAAWASAVEFSRRPKTTPSNCGDRRREGAKTSRQHRSPSRPTSARTRPNSARFPLGSANSTAPNVNSPRDALEDWGEFLRINSRLALHERQFYLRTPALGHKNSVQDTIDTSVQQENCVCRLCQVEAEAGLADHEKGYNCLKNEEHITYLALKNDHRGHILLPNDLRMQVIDGKKNVLESRKSTIYDHVLKQEANKSKVLTSDGNSEIIIANSEKSFSTKPGPDNQKPPLRKESQYVIINGEQVFEDNTGAKAGVVTNSRNSQRSQKCVENLKEDGKDIQTQMFVDIESKDVIKAGNPDMREDHPWSSDTDGFVRAETDVKSVKGEEKVAQHKEGIQNVTREIYIPSEPCDNLKIYENDFLEEFNSAENFNQGTNVSVLKDPDEKVKYSKEDTNPITVPKIMPESENSRNFSQKTNGLDEKEDTNELSGTGEKNCTSSMVLAEKPDNGHVLDPVTVMDIKTGELYVEFEQDTIKLEEEVAKKANLS